MKVLHVVFALETGGAETMLVDIANEQSRSEQVELIIINNIINGDLLQKLHKEIKVHFLSRRPGSLNPLKIVQFNYLIYKVAPDIIHFHDHKGIRLIKFKIKANSFLTVHDVKDPIGNLSKYDGVFSISKAVQKDVRDRGSIDSIMIYNGIDFSKIAAKSNYRNPGRFKIIQVSRLHHEKKGQDILLNAIQHLIYKLNVLNIRVDLIGEGPSLDYLKQLSISLGISDHVHFLGKKDRNYIYGHLKDYDLLVQPSIYEGFGLTVVEGIAAGLPVIVSDIDGPAEIVAGLPSCALFETGDDEALAQAILKTWKLYSEGLMEELCKRSYLTAIRKFSIRQTSQNYLSQYRNFSGLAHSWVP